MKDHTIKVIYEEISEEPIRKFVIDTEVVNGTISERTVDIPSGESRTITYVPKEGYQLKEIIVDGVKIKSEGNESEYLFEKIMKNHTIKVIYEEIEVEPIGKFVIETEVVNGTISERMVDIPSGESRTITYAPKEGYQLKEIIVDGGKTKLEGNESEYMFKGITKDHIIKVVYEKENHRDNGLTDNPVNGGSNNNDVKGGISSNPPKVSLVKTGDETALIMFAVAAGLALLVIGTILLLRRHHSIDKKIR